MKIRKHNIPYFEHRYFPGSLTLCTGACIMNKRFILCCLFFMVITCVPLSTGIAGAAEPEKHLDSAEAMHTENNLETLFQTESENKKTYAQAVSSMFGSLVFVIALIIITLWLVRKFRFSGIGGIQGGGLIQVLDLKTLADRQRIGIVRVGTHILIIGMHQQGMFLLKELENENVCNNIGIQDGKTRKQTSAAFSGIRQNFSGFLKNMMKNMPTT